jgi:hypothetical protein
MEYLVKKTLCIVAVTVMLGCVVQPAMGLYGDFNGNTLVEFTDLARLSELWLVTDCDQTASFDVDGDCTVNLHEFSSFADNWQKSTLPPVAPRRVGNSIIITPSADLISEYKALCVRTDMGTLSASNPRWLKLMPGVYDLGSGTSAKLILDRSYINIVGDTGNADDVVITGSVQAATANTSLVLQTCDTISLCGITMQNTPTVSGDETNVAHTFCINATSNATSSYKNCKFRNSRAAALFCEPVRGVSHLYGTWVDCEGDNASWRVAKDRNCSPILMKGCRAGDSSYGGDQDNDPSGVGVIDGLWEDCVGGHQSFGGCGSFGTCIATTCRMHRCKAGDYSFAIGKTAAGLFDDCHGGRSCFGGTGNGNGYGGKFTGRAINTSAEGGSSFGMWVNAPAIDPNPLPELSGQLTNCRNGDERMISGCGNELVVKEHLVDRGARASVSIEPVAGATITFRAKDVGISGNSIAVFFTRAKTASYYIADGRSGTGGKIEVHITGQNSNSTAAIVAAARAAVPQIDTILEITYSDGTETTGTDGTMHPLTGGADSIAISGCHPAMPTNCTMSLTILGFNNGHTYTNSGATRPVTFTLPAAIPGLKFRIVKVAAKDAGIIITRVGTDTIDGATSLTEDNDDTGECTVECFETGKWISTNKAGTWDPV